MKRIKREIMSGDGLSESPAAGCLIEVVLKGKTEQVDIYDGQDCTDEKHVDEHRVLMNPVVTDSQGRTVLCVPEGA